MRNSLAGSRQQRRTQNRVALLSDVNRGVVPDLRTFDSVSGSALAAGECLKEKRRHRWQTPFRSFFVSKSTAELRLLVLMSAFLVAPFHATAQTPTPNNDPARVDFAGLDIQAVAGWDGTVDTSTPVPFSFLISNFSEDVIEGQLTLTDPLNDRKVVLGDIFIGPNSVRRFSSIQAVPDWIQCVATFRNYDRIFWRRELAITTGKDFSEDLNYLLFVDDGNRMLQWPVDESTSESSSSRFIPKPGHGRPVQPLAAKSWQLPQHPGPLAVAQAMVFSEALKPDMLNDGQWDAIGTWMCLGGTVFVSEKSAEVIDRLKKATPLAMESAVNFEQFSVHRCGSGSVREYSGPLFSANDTKAPRLIADAAARLSRYNVMTMLDETKLSWWHSESAAWTQMLVVIVFGVYTLLSGVVTLLLFRLDRRRIAIYTGIVVLTACVASLVLGGVLRNSPGDLRWVTVTKAGPGGLVQVAKIDVQSAGGRNTQVTVRGRHVDMQLIESETVNSAGYYYYQTIESNRTGYPAFSLQANLLTEEPDACQIKVPITPWGYRQTYATAFDPAARGLEVKLTYEPSRASEVVVASMQLQSGAHLGKFTVTATNHLPFDLKNCQLVVSSTGVNLNETAAIQYFDSRAGSSVLRAGSSIGDLTHVESAGAIGDLIQSQTAIQPVNMVDAIRNDRGIYYGGNQPAPESLPRIAASGATSAWIVGRISRSPILSIDEQRSDFKAFEEMHIFVQEILPEDMPEGWLQLQQLRLEQLVESAAQMKSQNAPGSFRK